MKEKIPTMKTPTFEGKYCDNEELEEKIILILEALKSNDNETLNKLGVEKMIKTSETFILKANNNEGTPKRHRPGGKLVTYKNEFDENGFPAIETWGGEVANITEDSVILSNGPIVYPEGHEYAGDVVKGYYNEEGYFTVDQENGDTELHNEYVSDTSFVEKTYGVIASDNWESGFKLIPSYLSEVTEATGGAIIGAAKIKVEVGGFVAIDMDKDGNISSVRGISKSDLEKTYTNHDAYIESKKTDEK